MHGIRLTAVAAAFAAAACSTGTPPPEQPFTLQAAIDMPFHVPVQGTDSTLDAGTWNLEWFGDPERGPADEHLQLGNIRDVILGSGVDLWSVQEVTSGGHFGDLVAQLPGYDGFLANDPRVQGGAASYSDFGGNEQKVGLIYRFDLLTVEDAAVILADHDHAFAGRPPLEVRLTVTGDDGEAAPLVAILLHAKAGARAEDRQRRADGAAALRSYLDATHPTARVLVIGDFNDDVDTSITGSHDSPYADFVAAADSYAFPTASLSDAGVSSTVSYPDMVDHHLTTDELMSEYAEGSAEVFRVDELLTAYDATTTDHYPVLARYAAPGSRTAALPFAGHTVAYVDLSWTGPAATEIAVYLDGAVVATTRDDGAYTHPILLGPDTGLGTGSTVIFRICEALSDVCSPEVEVVL